MFSMMADTIGLVPKRSEASLKDHSKWKICIRHKKMKFAKNMQDNVIEDAEHDEHGPEAIWSSADGPIHVKKFA